MSFKGQLADLKKAVNINKTSNINKNPVSNPEVRKALTSMHDTLHIERPKHEEQYADLKEGYTTAINRVATTATGVDAALEHIKKSAELTDEHQKILNLAIIDVKLLSNYYTKATHAPIDIGNRLDKLNDNVRKLLESQIKAVEDKFSNPSFQTELEAKFPPIDPTLSPLEQTKLKNERTTAIEKYKKDIITELKGFNDSQKTVLDEQKKANDVIKKSVKDLDISLLLYNASLNGTNRRIVSDLLGKVSQEEIKGPLTLGSSIKGSDDRIGNTSIKFVKKIKTKAGTIIEQEVAGTVTMNERKGTFYSNLTMRDNLFEDYHHMASTVRAQGFEKVEISFTHPDKTQSDKDKMYHKARKQFEALVLAGFDPNPQGDLTDKTKTTFNITVNINGKNVPVEQLFKDFPNRLQALRLTYNNRKASNENALDNSLNRDRGMCP